MYVCVYVCRLFQVLVQALGVNVDMSFIMATFGVLSDLPTGKTEVCVCVRMQWDSL